MGVNEIVNPEIHKPGRRRPRYEYILISFTNSGVVYVYCSPTPLAPMLDIN
jgi:hypothetical protein